ncbi:MAG: cyclic nucleotide-binding domain-containing protein [Myxococcota bacterium]
MAKRGGQLAAGMFLAFFPFAPSRILPLTLLLCAVWVLTIMMTRSRYIELLTAMLKAPPATNPELQIYDAAAVRYLAGTLADAELERAAVILGILEQADERAPDFILDKLVAVRGEAGALLVIDHLASIGDATALLKFCRSESASVAGAALLAIDEVDAISSFAMSREIFRQPHHPEPLLALAAGLLASRDQEAQEFGLRVCHSTNVESRLALAQGLSRINAGAPPQVGEAICVLAQDQNVDIARTAMRALGKHMSPQACAVALQSLNQRVLRGPAMRALAELGPPVVGPLAKALAQELENPPIASALTWALGQVGVAAAAEPLLQALSAPHSTVRLSAAVALGSLHRRRPGLKLPLEAIAARFLPEIEYYGSIRHSSLVDLPTSAAGIVLRRTLSQRGHASIETLFRLMALNYPEEAILGAFQAIVSRDRHQRQLALELLETVLDPTVRRELAVAIGEGRSRIKTRDRTDVLQSLCQTKDRFLARLAWVVLHELDPKAAMGALKEAQDSMTHSLIDQILELQSISLFSHATAEDLGEIASMVNEREFTKDAVIFSEGEVGDAMYLIRAGNVMLTRNRHKVDRLGTGEAIGIVSVLDRLPREMTATADTPCSLFVIKATDLLQLLADRPLLMHSIFRALTSSIRGQLDRVALGKRGPTGF